MYAIQEFRITAGGGEWAYIPTERQFDDRKKAEARAEELGRDRPEGHVRVINEDHATVYKTGE